MEATQPTTTEAAAKMTKAQIVERIEGLTGRPRPLLLGLRKSELVKHLAYVEARAAGF